MCLCFILFVYLLILFVCLFLFLLYVLLVYLLFVSLFSVRASVSLWRVIETPDSISCIVHHSSFVRLSVFVASANGFGADYVFGVVCSFTCLFVWVSPRRFRQKPPAGLSWNPVKRGSSDRERTLNFSADSTLWATTASITGAVGLLALAEVCGLRTHLLSPPMESEEDVTSQCCYLFSSSLFAGL